MGGAVVTLVIMEMHTDFLVLFKTPDMTLTRRNQRVLSIQPKIPVDASNGTDHFGLVRPEYSNNPHIRTNKLKFGILILKFIRTCSAWRGKERIQKITPISIIKILDVNCM